MTSTNDANARAEIVAIREACAKSYTFQFTDCSLYTSCEPCPICLRAIYRARPKLLHCYSSEEAIDFDDRFIYDKVEKEIESRRIGIVQRLRSEALAVFKKPGKKNDKTNFEAFSKLIFRLQATILF